ncbi:MAG: hypothetical protein KJ043_20695 [Anaerolineae bacterium]|nr:hypothetical protein [Anaerolineae bacterium]
MIHQTLNPIQNTPLPMPDEHLKTFDWFIGEWDIASRMLMDAEKDEWIEGTLFSIHTYQMGGHIIFEHFFGPLGGQPLEAWSIRKFNNRTNRW